MSLRRIFKINTNECLFDIMKNGYIYLPNQVITKKYDKIFIENHNHIFNNNEIYLDCDYDNYEIINNNNTLINFKNCGILKYDKNHDYNNYNYDSQNFFI